MIIADTSIWIDHFRQQVPVLTALLKGGRIVMHPYVIGELAVGRLANRAVLLPELQKLPTAVVADNGEVLAFIERHALFGSGIGFIDAHLLAAVMLTGRGAKLWTSDPRLKAVADRLEVAAAPA